VLDISLALPIEHVLFSPQIGPSSAQTFLWC
jgi:hypothetical protein